MDAQQQMRNEMITGQYNTFPSFKQQLKQAAEAGLLLFIKYVLVILLAYAVLMFGTNIIGGASNGTQSALYLQELQSKGWLPKIVNGQIPPKMEDENAKNLK